MRRLLSVFSFLLLILFFVSSQAATLIPATPKIKARGYLLIDYNSGRVLAEKKSDQRMEPASLTKMLTSYVIANELANGNISLDDEVRISERPGACRAHACLSKWVKRSRWKTCSRA